MTPADYTAPPLPPIAPFAVRGRSVSNCKRASRCAYCGADLTVESHEHDHFPIPWRRGGREVVCACLRCHNFKDRTSPADVSDAFCDSAEEGLSPWTYRMLAFVLDWYECRSADLPPLDRDRILRAVDECSNWHARAFVAKACAVVLDEHAWRVERLERDAA